MLYETIRFLFEGRGSPLMSYFATLLVITYSAYIGSYILNGVASRLLHYVTEGDSKLPCYACNFWRKALDKFWGGSRWREDGYETEAIIFTFTPVIWVILFIIIDLNPLLALTVFIGYVVLRVARYCYRLSKRLQLHIVDKEAHK